MCQRVYFAPPWKSNYDVDLGQDVIVYCPAHLMAEGQMSDGYVIQLDVELGCSLCQALSDLQFPDASGHCNLRQ